MQCLRKIRPFVVGILKRKTPRDGLQGILWQLGFHVFQRHRAVEPQQRRRAAERRHRDRIVEHVVQPAQLFRLWRDVQAGPDQTQVVAFAWPEHHAVLTQLHRLLVAIRGEMAHRQHVHGRLLNATKSQMTASDSLSSHLTMIWPNTRWLTRDG